MTEIRHLDDYMSVEEAVALQDEVTEARDSLLRKLKPGMRIDLYIREAGAGTVGGVVFSISGEMV